MSALRDVYGKIPGGSGAIVVEGGASKLNMACPRLRDDLRGAFHQEECG